MNTKKYVFVLPLLLVLLLQAFSAVPAYADSSVGTGAIASCNEAALDAALAVGGPVTFDCGGPATILLTGTKVITKDTQINGAGLITLDGGNSVRLFIVNSPAVLDLSNLTLTRGFIDHDNGGAILINKDAIVNIRNSTLSNNKTASGYGGAIYVGEGRLNVFDSTFSNNNAEVESLGNLSLGGGAIQNNDGTVNISGSTFKGNSVTSHTADGGAIYNGDYDGISVDPNVGVPDLKPDVLNVTNSTFYGNYLQNNSGLPTSGNSAGAVRSSSELTITHSTFSNNESGIPMFNGAAGAITVTDGIATYKNNIFANSTGADCAVRFGVTQTSIGNLIMNNTPEFGWGCGQPVETNDPLLGPLQNNGGLTETMVPGIGSPAIDKAASCEAASDQRGLLRPQPIGGTCDLGAVEVDKDAPILSSFVRLNPATSLTREDVLVFRANFSGTVLEVDTTDFVVIGGTTATVTNVSTVNSGTYDITVSGGNLASFTGTVGLNLSNNQHIVDLNGMPLPQGEPAVDETYVLDNSGPYVVSILRTDPNPTTAATVHFSVTFSEPVLNVGMNDFVLYKAGTNKATILNVSGSGAVYTVSVDTGTNYGIIRLDVPGTATVLDVVGNPSSGLPYQSGQTYTINKALTFADVPPTHPYWQDIEILYANNMTAGCVTSPLKYCPDQIMNRGEAAVFILRANFGPSYLPPAAAHIFRDDWSKGPWAEPWAEAMRNNGLSAGCLASPLKYCPWDLIPREQAVIFALRMKYGALYTPPPATGTLFADMTNPSYYATPWAEQAYKDGIIPSCGMSGGKPKICPKDLVSRGLGAYMIVRAKSLTMP